MATRIYLKLGDIQGDCTEKGHENWISVMSWSWGMSRPAAYDGGEQAQQTSPITNDLTIVKWLDISSPRILLAFCKGEQIDKAVVESFEDGKPPAKGKSSNQWRQRRADGIRMTVSQASVISINLAGSIGDIEQTESFYLKFAKVEYEYIGDNEDKKKRSAMKWDLLKNATF